VVALIEEFDSEIQHRPGSRHQNADALSRRPCRQCGRTESDSEDTSVPTVVAHGTSGVAACRAGHTADPDYRPGGGSSALPPSNDETTVENPVWRVYSPDELAEMQKSCPDIGFVVRLRLAGANQPSVDVVRPE